MNKKDQITFYKKQLQAATELKLVANQNLQLATRLESIAKSALEELGANSGQVRKVNELSDEQKISLLASLTNKKSQRP